MPQRREFLALSTETPIVRYFDLAETVKPLAVTPPLRVLVMLSNPSDVDCLDVEKEWQKLKEAVGYLEERKLLIVERMHHATLSELQRRLRREQYHIFHFVGHGSFDQTTEESVLALEDEDGRKRLVSGPDLGIYLRDEPALRLVLLNACEGARGSRSDPFSGAAQSLVLKGIPAVIAMQFEVSDEAAIAMASGFYAALADDYPVDAALTEARKSVFAAGCTVEWGTPVLYLRAPDGRIFDINRTEAQLADPALRPPNLPTVAPPPLPPVRPPPLEPVVRPEPVVSRAPEMGPLPELTEKRGARPWIWIVVGMVAMFATFIGLGAYINWQRSHGKSAMPEPAPAAPAAAEPVYDPKASFKEPPASSKTEPESMNQPAMKNGPALTDAELQSLRSQTNDLSALQQQSSKSLDEMDKQARDAINHIKSGDSSSDVKSFSTPEPGPSDGQIAGAAFEPYGWWEVATSPPYAFSRVRFDSNGRFAGTARDATGATMNLSGYWSYQPATSLLSVNYDNGMWARVVLVRKGRGFYSSFNQNNVTNEVYMEKEGQTAAPTAVPYNSKKY